MSRMPKLHARVPNSPPGAASACPARLASLMRPTMWSNMRLYKILMMLCFVWKAWVFERGLNKLGLPSTFLSCHVRALSSRCRDRPSNAAAHPRAVCDSAPTSTCALLGAGSSCALWTAGESSPGLSATPDVSTKSTSPRCTRAARSSQKAAWPSSVMNTPSATLSSSKLDRSARCSGEPSACGCTCSAWSRRYALVRDSSNRSIEASSSPASI
mmetsp:Transcript_37083/g.112096  ORF Transcript_37083/g.112096 Transcript_37083/m.112096 type:complete len:214 (-) Transcript_37083:827-1468(-)